MRVLQPVLTIRLASLPGNGLLPFLNIFHCTMDDLNTAPEREDTNHTSVPEPPFSPPFSPRLLSRQATGSSIHSTTFEQLPPGFIETFLHGNCPQCHHWHNKVTLRVSRNPGVFSGVRCERCSHRWFGIGGNSTHTSLLSQESWSLDDSAAYRPTRPTAIPQVMIQAMHALSAVGSPALSAVPEDPAGNNRSPISRQQSRLATPARSHAPSLGSDAAGPSATPTTVVA